MKKLLFSLLFILVALSSCKTYQKIIYFQDVCPDSVVKVLPTQTLRFVPGDRLAINITSSATPELADRYNLTVGGRNGGYANNNVNNTRYTVDENGNIDVPGIGRVCVGGLTRSEVATKIQALFRNGIINDAIVTVSAYDQVYYVMGEVSSPGKKEINRDNLNIIQTLAQCNDLSILAQRNRIKVLRQEGDEIKTYYVDIRSKDIFTSPVYNIQQNDIIYVEPNKVRMGQSNNNENSLRSISMWMSITSFLTSIAILITNAVK